MSNPDFVLVTLDKSNGTSCGAKEHRFKNNGGTYSLDPDATGDFTWGQLKAVTINGASSWELSILITSGACFGLTKLWRSPGADDPVGSYCQADGTVMDCDEGQATVFDDD